jgi:hypothetical protein
VTAIQDSDAVTSYASLTVTVVVVGPDGEMGIEVSPSWWSDDATTSPFTVGVLVAYARGFASAIEPNLAPGYSVDRIDLSGAVNASGTRSVA